MFLSELTIKEKYYFLELANKVICADGKIAEVEQELFKSYKREMELNKDYKITDIDIDTIVKNITSTRVQKIFFIELLALCIEDNDFNSAEKAIIDKLTREFNISENFYRTCERWIQEFNDVYKAGFLLINQ